MHGAGEFLDKNALSSLVQRLVRTLTDTSFTAKVSQRGKKKKKKNEEEVESIVSKVDEF